MKTTTAPRRIALLPVDARTAGAVSGGAVRRYRLGRVIGDLGPALASQPAAAQAAGPGVRAP